MRINVKLAFCNDIKLITLKNDTSVNRYYGEKSSKISKLEGTVAPNFGQKGGGYQYYVPNLETVLIEFRFHEP